MHWCKAGKHTLQHVHAAGRARRGAAANDAQTPGLPGCSGGNHARPARASTHGHEAPTLSMCPYDIAALHARKGDRCSMLSRVHV